MSKSLLIDGEHMTRLMKLCRALCVNSALPMPQLLNRLGRSRRTLFRDLKELKSAGIQIENGTGGYRIRVTIPACRRAITRSVLSSAKAVLKQSLK